MKRHWRIRSLWTITAVAIGCGCQFWGPSGGKTPALSVSFIDVGQGQSVFIRDQNRHEILVDVGSEYHSFSLVDFLESEQVDTIETVVISHPHEDHYGGLANVAARFPIRRVLWKNAWPFFPDNKRIYKLCDSLHIPAFSLETGDTLADIENCRIQCLWPDHEVLGLGEDSVNASSAVLLVRFQATSLLLPGDIPASVESLLVCRYKDSLHAGLLAASHHGSKYSNSLPWLGCVSPSKVVISCGRNNLYGHPAPEALLRFQAVNPAIYRTDLEKTVTFHTNGWDWQQQEQ